MCRGAMKPEMIGSAPHGLSIKCLRTGRGKTIPGWLWSDSGCVRVLAPPLCVSFKFVESRVWAERRALRLPTPTKSEEAEAQLGITI